VTAPAGSPSGSRPRILILGGGMAAVTAAYFLSGSQAVREKYEIVLYQQGWRLGGKGASGRGVGDRIEEHGLHVWFGYYENAFRLLRDCHQELDERASRGEKRWSTTMHSIDAGFRPISSIGIVEDEAPGWRPWIATFPEDDTSPWDRDLASEPPDWDLHWYLKTLLTRSVALLATVVRSAGDEYDLAETSIELAGAAGFEEVLVGLGRCLADGADPASGPADALAAVATRLVEALVDHPGSELYDVADQVVAVGSRLLDAVRLRLDERLVVDRPSVRRLWSFADVLLAVVRGLLHHRVTDEQDYEALDEYEFRTWLVLHGALAESTTSSLVRTLAYDLPFAYRSGDPDLSSCGAGTAIRTLFRVFFTYRGALMWKMNAGMGDVVFAPLYELLHKRGVTFKFFHQVTDIHTDGERVSGLTVRKQDGDRCTDDGKARLRKVCVTEGGRMRPGKLCCWPAAPPGWSAEQAETLEAWWNPASGTPVEEPVGEDDLVVFGLGLGTVPYVARTLLAERREWRDMVDRVKTTATQAMQIWVDRPAERLGWFEDAVVGGYDAPFDTVSDMPELRFHERIGAATVLYLCAVLPDGDDGERPASAAYESTWVGRRREYVRAQAADFIERQAVGLLPGAVDPATGRYDQRIQLAQFVRGNFQPSDRYVLSVPGSVRYRLDPGRTGYSNLVVAGDWTRNVINAGCVEAATISGMTAAEAILQRLGTALPVPVIGRIPQSEGADDV
jgi:uncharacterized protein with NAD-binding domain and iron-sulfur cluster